MRSEGKPLVNIGYGVVGLVSGVGLLVLNVTDPAYTDTSDWVWCAIAFVVGAFLLYRGVVARQRS